MSRFKTFRSDIKASVSMSLGIMMFPILGTIGTAVDYSRGTQAKAVLQSAVDSTILMLAREAPKLSAAQLTTLGAKYFAALMAKHPDIATGGLNITKTDKTVKIATSGSVKTVFAGIFGWPNWALDVGATSAYGTKTIEIALVLDNTGSMAAMNKIGELKKASHALLNILEASAVKADQIKVALVPYTTRVNLGESFRDANWLTNTPTGAFSADYIRPATRAAWKGCVADRDTTYNNSVKPVGVPVVQSLYPMVNCPETLAQAQPLTANFTLLRSRINAMSAAGNTNITLGAQVGYEMLSANAPFSEAATGPNVERFMILLTDGENTQDRFASTNAKMNADTRTMCDAITERGVAEAAKTLKIKLYTVLVIAGNEPLLKSCATTPAMFKKVNQASELESVFKAIAEEIGGIRLTM